MNTQLRWIHRPFAELIRLAWPIAVSMLSISLMSVVDTLFVSGIGASALAGVGLAGAAMFTFLCFSVGLLRGVKVVVSQAMGAGRERHAADYLGAGLAIGGAFGVVTCLAVELGAPLLHHLVTTVEAGEHAVTYLRIRVLAAPAYLLFVALRESCYARGDARVPMIASVTANLVNGALDLVFVVFLDLGVAGVAWATAIAGLVEMAVLFAARFHEVRALSRVKWSAILAVWRVGLPTGGQFLLQVGAFALLAALISMMSEVEMAAHQLVFHLLLFCFLPANAVAEAGSVLAGQAVGADRDDLVYVVARRALALAGGYTALCTAIIWLAAPEIIGAFTDDGALAVVAVRLMYIATIFLVADGANMVVMAILRGAGDVRHAAVVGIASAWVFTPPLTWLLGYQAGLGAAGGWIGLCCEIAVCVAILSWRLWRGSWRAAAEESRAQVRGGVGALVEDLGEATGQDPGEVARQDRRDQDVSGSATDRAAA